MGYTNNRTTAVHTKITNKGREKIATGNLNLEQWSIGDSEINYEREDYNYDNGITDSPARVLKAVDMQPSLKYFIRDVNQKTKFDLQPNDIKVAKYTISSNISNFGLEPNNPNDNSKLIFSGILTPTNLIDSKRIRLAGTYLNNTRIGDIVILKFDSGYATYKIDNIVSDIAELDRDIVGFVSTNGHTMQIIPGGVVSEVPMWNVVDQITYSPNGMEYQNTNGAYTPVMDFNIVTYENIMGYIDKNTTRGYEMIGFMENYLSYNDSLNSVSMDENPCTVDVVVGEEDKLQRFIGIAHYTNENRSNLFGDFFHVDHARNKKVEYTLPQFVKYVDTKLTSSGEVKFILDTDIEYYDMVGNISGKVLGKVLPQLKMIIFDDHELITIMSTSSGRHNELPMINSELITSTNGILESGKQMYISYGITTNGKSFPCQKYNLVKNTTTTAKDVKLLLPNNNETLNTTSELVIVYQITNIGERPIATNWVSRAVNNGNTNNTVITFNPLNTINLVINEAFNAQTNTFELIRYMFGKAIPPKNIFGDETVLFGWLSFNCGSNTFRSTITINVNPNLMVDTTNPTYLEVKGVKPFITFSEIGIYDKDGDLVMISKVTRPVTLTSNSTIRVEIGLDF